MCDGILRSAGCPGLTSSLSENSQTDGATKVPVVSCAEGALRLHLDESPSPKGAYASGASGANSATTSVLVRLGPPRVARVDAAHQLELLQGQRGRVLVLEVHELRGRVVKVVVVVLGHVDVEERAEDLLVHVEGVGVPLVSNAQGREQVVHVHRGGIQQAPGAAQVVSHRLGQGDGLVALAPDEEDLHQTATDGDDRGGGPGGLDDTGVPELGKQPLQVLVVLLLAHEADEAVQLRRLELDKVDVHALAGHEGLAQDGLGQLQHAVLHDGVGSLGGLDAQAGQVEGQLEGEGDGLRVLEAVLAGHELVPGRGQADGLRVAVGQQQSVNPGGDSGAGDEEDVVLVETELAELLDDGNHEGTGDDGLSLDGGTKLLHKELEERLLDSDELLGMLLLVELEEDVQASTIEHLVLHRQHLAGHRQAVAVVQDTLGQQVGHDVGEGVLDDSLARVDVGRLSLGGTKGLLESSDEHHGTAVDVVGQLHVRDLLDGDGTSDLAAGNDVETQLLQQSPGLDREAAGQVGLGKSSAGLVQLGRVNASLASNAGLGKNLDNGRVKLRLSLLADLRLVRAGPDTNKRGQAAQCSLVSAAVLLLVDLELLLPEDLGLLGGFGAHNSLGLASSTSGGRAVDLGLGAVQSSEVTLGGSDKRQLEGRLLGIDGLAALRSSSLLLLGLGDNLLADLDSLLLVLHVVALAGDGNEGHGGRQGDIGLGTVDLGAGVAVLNGNLANLLDRDLEMGLEDDDVPLVDGLHKLRRHVVLLSLLGESEPHGGVDGAELGPALLLVVDLGESDSGRKSILADDTLGVLVRPDQLEVVAVGSLDAVLHTKVTHNVESPDGERVAGSQGGLVALKKLLVNSKDLGPLLSLLVELDQLVGRLGDELVLDLQAREQRALEDGRVQLLGRLSLVRLSVRQGKAASELDSDIAVCVGEAVLARAAKIRPDLLEQLGADLNALSPLLLVEVERGQSVAGLDLALDSNNSDLPSLALGPGGSRGRHSSLHNLVQNSIGLVVLDVGLIRVDIGINRSLDANTTLGSNGGLGLGRFNLLLLSLLLDSAHKRHSSVDSRSGSLLARALEVAPHGLEDCNSRVQDAHGLELLTNLVQLVDDSLRLVLSHVLVVEPDTMENVLGLGLTALATQEASVGNADLDLALVGLGDLSGSGSDRSAAAVLSQTTPERDVKLLSMGVVLLRLVRVRHAQGNLDTTDVKDVEVALSSLEDGLGVLHNLLVLGLLVQDGLELLSSGTSLGRELTVLGNGGLVDTAVHGLGLFVLLDASVQLGKLVVVLGSKSAVGTTTLFLRVDDVLQKLLTLSDSIVAGSSLLLDGGGDVKGLDGTGDSELVGATENSLSDLGSLVEVLARVCRSRELLVRLGDVDAALQHTLGGVSQSGLADGEGQNMRGVGLLRQRLLVPAPLLETGQKGRVGEDSLELSSNRGSLDLATRVKVGALEVRQPVASGVLKQSVRLEEAVDLNGADGIQAALDVPSDADLDVQKETGSQVLVGLIGGKKSILGILGLLLAELQEVQADRLVAEANGLVLDDHERSAGILDVLDDVGRSRLVKALLDLELKQGLDLDRGEGSLRNKQPADDQASIATQSDGRDMLCQNLIGGAGQLLDGSGNLGNGGCLGQEPKRHISPGQRALAANSNLLRDILDLLLVTKAAADEPSASHVLHILSGALRSHDDLAGGLGPGRGEGTAEEDNADVVLVLGGDVVEVLKGLELVGLITLQAVQTINDQDNILKTLERSVKSVPESVLSIVGAVGVGIQLRHVGEAAEQGDVAHVLLKELQQQGLDQSNLCGLSRNLAVDRRRDGLVLMVTNAALQPLEDPVEEEALASSSLGCDGEDAVPATGEIHERTVKPLAGELGTGSASRTATGHKSLKLAILGEQPLADALDRDLGNAVLVADKGLHAVAKGQVEVDRDAGARHGTRALAVENGHLDRESEHVGQRQAEVPPGLGNGDEHANITLVEIEGEAILVEDAKGPLQGLAVLRSELHNLDRGENKLDSILGGGNEAVVGDLEQRQLLGEVLSPFEDLVPAAAPGRHPPETLVGNEAKEVLARHARRQLGLLVALELGGQLGPEARHSIGHDVVAPRAELFPGLGDADRLVTTALALSSMLLLFLVLLSSGTAVASDAAENPEASETVRS
ncbi:hypothetical protein VSDG_05609 [Cytospora chrysosperma]|uniref:Uncharacterized protein n=1 Tax=Cytospora chrysosperma TaxID=252740 RepID=A0A423VZW9_CYTCH|nr:hypothetical protein VSDG_05609 [Valsa sordida]